MKNRRYEVCVLISLLMTSLLTITYAAPNKSAVTETVLAKEQSNKYMIRFQDAIKEADWEKALSYCSSDIKSKAQTYESVEAFFKDVLPVDNITALSGFWISQVGYHDDIIRCGCELSLKAPNYKYKVGWILSVLNKDKSWVIDFPVKPLDIWLKHSVLKSKVVNSEVRIEPEICRAGFDMRLIPLTEKFDIGKPMLFRIEMRNISKKTLGYWHTTFMVNDPMLIKDSEGAIVPFIDSSSQTGAGPEFVEPGETIVLADNYDARSQYHITKSGKYTFRFKGDWIKPSNIVEKEIEPNPLSAMENIVEDLMAVLPEGWTLSRTIAPASKFAVKSSANEAIWVHLHGEGGSKTKGNNIFIAVAIFLHNPDPKISHIKLKSHLSNFSFWGKSKWGLVYGSSRDAELLWPDYKNEIKKVLQVSMTALFLLKNFV